MASGQYTKALELAVAGGVLWTSGTIRVLLVDSSYAYDPDHATVADVIADELGVSGYARATLASKTATLDAGNNRVSLDAADVTFSALGVGATIGGAVVFRRAGGADDNTDLLLAFVDLNDLVTNGGDVVIAWNAGGILRFAVA